MRSIVSGRVLRLRLAALLLGAGLQAGGGRSWAAPKESGAPERLQAAPSVIHALRNAAQTASLSQAAVPAAASPDKRAALRPPAAVLAPNAGANLAYLIELEARSPHAEASSASPADSPQASLRQLGVANKILGRFKPELFRKLPPAELEGVLNELWDGIRKVSGRAAPAQGGLRSAKPSAASLGRASGAGRFKNLLLEGASPEMPIVARGEVVYWEPEEAASSPRIAGPADPAPLAEAKLDNEMAALRALWASAAAQAGLKSPAREAADLMVERAAIEVQSRRIKSQFAIEEALRRAKAEPDSAEAAGAVERLLLPALHDRAALVYLPEGWSRSTDRDEFRRALIRQEKDLFLARVFDRILRFPYGFAAADENGASGQRRIALSRRFMMQESAGKVLAGIERGLPAERAMAPVIEELRQFVAKTEAQLAKEPGNSLFRNNLTVFMELDAAFQAIRKGLRAPEQVYAQEDSPPVRRAKVEAELAKHRRAWTRTTARFPAGSGRLRAFMKEAGESIEDRISRGGLPAQLAAAAFFAGERDRLSGWDAELGDGEKGPIDALMFYSYALRGGASREGQAPRRDLVVFAREIRDESDYAEILMRFEEQGRIKAIVTPRLSYGHQVEGRLPHWTIFAKPDGIVAVPFLDMRRAGLEPAALGERAAKGGLFAVVDGQRGQLLLGPGREALARWQARGAAYGELDALYRARALLPARFKGEEVALWADEANPAAFEGAQAPASRSGAKGVGLFRFEQFMGRLGVERDQRRLSLEFGKVLAQPFFAQGAPLVVRLFDFERDKRPEFLRRGRPGEEIAALLETHSNSRFYLDKNEPTLREFGKIQLKAVFQASWRGPPRNVRVLFSNVRSAGEAEGIEELLEEARAEFLAEELKLAPAAADRESLKRDITRSLQRIPIGYMIEEAETVDKADVLFARIASLRRVSPNERFIGVGTNDLNKSILKGDPLAWEKLSKLQPQLVRAIWRIGVAAERQGLEVTVEGEWGSSPRLTVALLALRALESVRVIQVAHTEAIPALYELIRAATPRDLGSPARGDLKGNLLGAVRAVIHDAAFGLEGFDRLAQALVQKLEDRIAASRAPPRHEDAQAGP